MGSYNGIEAPRTGEVRFELFLPRDTLGRSKQNFLKLHETGHHEIPTHRKLFRIFQDCEKTLAPEIADLFEREANNFARFALFQGNAYAQCAADCDFDIKTPIKLAKRFGSSVHASAREFARTRHRAYFVYILEPITYVDGDGAQAIVRRIEPSLEFLKQFGRPGHGYHARPPAWTGSSNREENDAAYDAFTH